MMPENETGLSMVVAADEKNGIGRQGTLPWHLPADLKHFKDLTMGKDMLMGRTTFASLGRVLPGRRHLVLSRKQQDFPEGVLGFTSFEAALAAAQPKAVVIGGASLFGEALPRIETIFLTRIHATFNCDTFLPEFDWKAFEVVSIEHLPANAKNAVSMTFYRLERK